MHSSPMILVGNDDGGTIAAFRVEPRKLEPMAVSAVGTGCSTFVVHPEGRLVFCATAEPAPAILTLELDPASGGLTETSRRDLPDQVHYLALSDDARVLLGASYGGGWGEAWRLEGHTVGESLGRVEHANLHCVATRDGHAYFASLGDDVVAVRALRADGLATDGQDVACPRGSGPRHLVFSDDGTSLYLLTEFTGEVIRFDRGPDGQLTLAESACAHDASRGLGTSRYGADPRAEHLVWAADLHLAGRYLLCSERTESTIATIRLDEAGRLGEIAAVTDTECQPRGFAVSGDGRRVVVVGEESGQASLYNLEDDGSLTVVDRVPAGQGPNWVRFVG